MYTTELTDQTHLKHRLASLEEFNEARNDAALDDTLDGWVLLLGEQLAELGRRLKLAVGIVGEHALDHILRELGGLSA